MNVSQFRTARAQGGFTLIELIVVIVILGILAATALPKFADLGGDARYATLKAAEASIKSVSAMAHARALTTGTQDAKVTFEGSNEITLVNGYPPATTDLTTASGLTTADYEFDTATANKIIVMPKGLTTAKKATCKLEYTAATSSAVPVVLLTASPSGC